MDDSDHNAATRMLRYPKNYFDPYDHEALEKDKIKGNRDAIIFFQTLKNAITYKITRHIQMFLLKNIMLEWNIVADIEGIIIGLFIDLL